MSLSYLDWSIVIAFFAISLGIGLWSSRRASTSKEEYFLSGRKMPWWLLGVSMVATTFSADTPALVTDIVRQNGVSGNWIWWAFLLTGMLTVFIYARLWRRSGILTDLEFYELRYSGEAATFLRGFRAVYLGLIFNILVMASVCLAAIKIGSTLFGLSPIHTLLISASVTVIYSALGGLRSIILTDFFQFVLAMIGSIWATIYIVQLPEIGGLDNLLTHEAVRDKLDIIPSTNDPQTLLILFILPLTVQWWASYYPGSEPGGGGYIVQRMLASKNEKEAIYATLVFNIAHYALRPWPWILIGLASLVIFPSLQSISTAFPDVEPGLIGHDLAYSAMLTYLPAGLLGLVAASLVGAFMSTISTHLNWGTSYLINDVYHRFINPEASEAVLVHYSRILTIVIMVLAGALSLNLDTAKDTFEIIVLIGAGTGLIYILRWFWWRINAYSEIAAMVISFIVALAFKFVFTDIPTHWALIISVTVTTLGWIIATYLTPQTKDEILISFYERIHPYGKSWQNKMTSLGVKLIKNEEKFNQDLILIILASFGIYGALIGTGFVVYGSGINGIITLAISILLLGFVIKKLVKLRT